MFNLFERKKEVNSEKICKNFRQNIRYLRKVHNMSQKEMASVMDVGIDTLRRIERGVPAVKINSSMLCNICDYFDLSADEMIYSILEYKQLN